MTTSNRRFRCRFLCAMIGAATFVVDSTVDAVDAEPGDGVCATEDDTCTLRAAVQEADALPGSHVIQLPAGTYTLTIPGTGETDGASGDLNIASDRTITINGAGASTTIIDANAIDRAFNVLPRRPPTTPPNGRLSLADLTVQNGLTDATRSPSDGGCLFVDTGHLVLTRVVVKSCRAPQAVGGAIASYGTALQMNPGLGWPVNLLTVTDSVITQSTAFDSGGGIYLGVGTTAAVTRSTISANSARAGAGIFVIGVAGAFSSVGSKPSTLTVGQSTIGQNIASDDGGGVVVSDSTTATIANSTIADNSASRGGGIFGFSVGLGFAANVSVTASTLSRNIATGTGGGAGVHTLSGMVGVGSVTLGVANSTMTGNAATGGGAGAIMAGTGSVVTLTNVTVAQNSSSIGALARSPSFNSTLSIGNTIVAGNPDGNCLAGSVTQNLGHNLEYPGTSCNFSLASDRRADPLLEPLASNGGATQTHALQAGSPAVDAADDAMCRSLPVSGRDQRGFQRSPFSPCDIGAYEFGAAASGFSDDPLISRTTAIKALHFAELRLRIDGQRTRFGLPPFQWNDTSLAGLAVDVTHLQQLRDALLAAFDAAITAGVAATPPSFTDGALNRRQTVIKAVHLTELRTAVLSLEAK